MAEATSHRSTQDTAKMSDSKPCRLLTLPAEMRNRIYKTVLATGNGSQDEDGNINICHASPPSKALFLTCKQIHDEASGLYRDALRDYWTTNTFTLDRRTYNPTSEDKAHIMSLETEDMLHMQRLNVSIGFAVGPLAVLFPNITHLTWTLSPKTSNGVWEHVSDMPPIPGSSSSVRSPGHMAILRRDADDIKYDPDRPFGDAPFGSNLEETKGFCEQNVDRVLTLNEQIVEVSNRVDAMMQYEAEQKAAGNGEED